MHTAPAGWAKGQPPAPPGAQFHRIWLDILGWFLQAVLHLPAAGAGSQSHKELPSCLCTASERSEMLRVSHRPQPCKHSGTQGPPPQPQTPPLIPGPRGRPAHKLHLSTRSRVQLLTAAPLYLIFPLLIPSQSPPLLHQETSGVFPALPACRGNTTASSCLFPISPQ